MKRKHPVKCFSERSKRIGNFKCTKIPDRLKST